MLALFALNAFSFMIADEGFLADACGAGFHVLAFLWDLRVTPDHEWQRGVAVGHAIQGGGEVVFDVHFMFMRAHDVVTIWTGCGDFHRHVAVGSRHALSIGVFQVSFRAEASNDAVLGAHSARVRVGAGGRASRAAGLEHFVGTADWWHHHE